MQNASQTSECARIDTAFGQRCEFVEQRCHSLIERVVERRINDAARCRDEVDVGPDSGPDAIGLFVRAEPRKGDEFGTDFRTFERAV